MQNKIIIGVVVVLVISGSFYAGTKYASAQRGAGATRANFARGAQAGQLGGAAGKGMTRQGGGMVLGEVISKDAQGINVKLQDGGSKIVFISSGTQITRSVTGTFEDVAVGGQVQVAGDQNPDGSITAKSIQLRAGASVAK